jgi:hypothetical protein
MLDRCKAMMGSRGAAGSACPIGWTSMSSSWRRNSTPFGRPTKPLKPLYGALSEEQKKIADQMFWGPMGMM